MSSASAAASLQANADFASELFLNRIMNGQVRPDSGKTVSAASRALAGRLDATAKGCGILAANVSAAQALVQGAQNAMTEMLEQIRHLGDAAGSMSDPDVRTLAAGVKANLDALLATRIDFGQGAGQAVDVLGNSGKAITLGFGPNETMTVGNADVANGTAYAALANAITASTLTAANVGGLCDAAVTELLGKIAEQGAQYTVLADRHTMLNDLTDTYHMASDNQAMSAGGSAGTLLSETL